MMGEKLSLGNVEDHLTGGFRTEREHSIGTTKATPPQKVEGSSKKVSGGFKHADASFNQPDRPTINTKFKASPWYKGKPGAR